MPLSPNVIFFHQMAIDSTLTTLYGILEQKLPSSRHELSKSFILLRIIKVIFLVLVVQVSLMFILSISWFLQVIM